MQVYCTNCKYYTNDWTCADRCKKIILRDYLGCKILDSCALKNKKCDCKDYEKKWYKFWIK